MPANLTKAQIISDLASSTGLTQTQVKDLFQKLEDLTKKELKRTGQFNVVPGLIQVKVKTNPARPARQGFRPGTRETMTFKAKPASKTVKPYARKALKELI